VQRHTSPRPKGGTRSNAAQCELRYRGANIRSRAVGVLRFGDIVESIRLIGSRLR